MQDILLYSGSGIVILWGFGHLIPTRNVVSGFGDLSVDNKRIITMEWIAEGFTLCFIGALMVMLLLTVGADNAATHLSARACAFMLFVMAGLSMFTGARTSILPMKLCPYIKSVVGIIYVVASFL